MNKSIKNIFAITALTLTFASTLRCEDTATQASFKSKLQSAVEYIKNIRTPLTPQEILAQHIAYADVTGLKDAYNSFQKWPADERVATLQALAKTTQEVKQQLQTELESNDNKVNKTTFAKGVAQTIVGTYATLATMFSLAYKGDGRMHSDGRIRYYGVWDHNPKNTSMMRKLLEVLGEHYLTIPIFIPEAFPWSLRRLKHEKLAALANIIITPLTGYLAYNSLNAGIQNCKNGWNYKAYIEQQITNIDEISAFIQEQLK